MPAVLLATCAALPEGDEDGALLIAALAAQGVTGTWAAWTDPDVDWSAALVVLRSTWDYTADRDAFLGWANRVPRLANEASVVRWNTDKVYLADLAAAGIPIVATEVARPGEQAAFPAGVPEFVVKPSVGAGSRGAGRFPADRIAAAREHAIQLQAAGRTVLVQPYLDAVDVAGETALVYLDGAFSHAVRKGPMLPPGVAHPVQGWELFVEEQISARVPDPGELAVGDAVLDVIRSRFGADQLYARVDLLPTPDGPVVVELELTEPSLFLQHGAPGTDPAMTFAAAVAARA
jgi:predicted ribosomally synthesized peptide with SipW-like signal peptide